MTAPSASAEQLKSALGNPQVQKLAKELGINLDNGEQVQALLQLALGRLRTPAAATPAAASQGHSVVPPELAHLRPASVPLRLTPFVRQSLRTYNQIANMAV